MITGCITDENEIIVEITDIGQNQNQIETIDKDTGKPTKMAATGYRDVGNNQQ